MYEKVQSVVTAATAHWHTFIKYSVSELTGVWETIEVLAEEHCKKTKTECRVEVFSFIKSALQADNGDDSEMNIYKHFKLKLTADSGEIIFFEQDERKLFRYLRHISLNKLFC